MRQLILIFFSLLLASCALTPEHKAQLALNKRFVYQDEPTDDWKYLPDVGPAPGDCEDYAITLQLTIGGELWIINDGAHMVLVKNRLVYENRRWPYSSNNITGEHKVISRKFARVRAITDSLNKDHHEN